MIMGYANEFVGNRYCTLWDPSTVDYLHDDARRISPVMHIKVLRRIQQIDTQLLRLKMLDGKIALTHLWCEQLIIKHVSKSRPTL
jgi:hypothetical protein